jgi:hypothetical protein
LSNATDHDRRYGAGGACAHACVVRCATARPHDRRHPRDPSPPPSFPAPCSACVESPHPHCSRNWRCDDKSTQLLHPSCAVRRLCDRKTCERFLSCQWPPPSSSLFPLPPTTYARRPTPYRRLRLLRPRITTCLMPCLTFVNDLQHPKVLERAPGADAAAAAAAAASAATRMGCVRVCACVCVCVCVNAVWPHVMSVLC